MITAIYWTTLKKKFKKKICKRSRACQYRKRVPMITIQSFRTSSQAKCDRENQCYECVNYKTNKTKGWFFFSIPTPAARPGPVAHSVFIIFSFPLFAQEFMSIFEVTFTILCKMCNFFWPGDFALQIYIDFFFLISVKLCDSWVHKDSCRFPQF